MIRERLEWEATKGPIKVKDVGLDLETRQSTPEMDKENERPPEQAV